MNYGLTGLERIQAKAKRWYHQLFKLVFGSKPINWSKWVQKTYILHLEDRYDRFKALNKELSQIKTTNGTLADEVTWFSALKDVKSWPADEHINEYSFEFHWAIDPDPWFYRHLDELGTQIVDCSNAETAIALGHIRMWRQFLESDAETAMFLEDDIYFDYQF